MRAALIQMDIAWESIGENHERAEELVGRAAGNGCDLAVLPEMFTTGFTMNLSAVEGAEKNTTAAFLSSLSIKHGISLLGGFPVRPPGGGKGRNIAQAYDRQGQLLATYTKIHPFSLAGEDKVFEAGDTVPVFHIDETPASIFICYDLRFPELFRKIAPSVEAVFVIANWPASRLEHWMSLLKARAIENQCFVLGLNRTGTDGNGIHYSGSSAVFGPSGEAVCSAGNGEEILVADIDPADVRLTRMKFPFLHDMGYGLR
jgi:predicted amidohydrolase